MLVVSTAQEACDMDQIESARVRLEQATGLPAVLDAGYEAFEEMLPALEEQEDRGGAAFAAFVMSATAAANGRDALAAAPSLPPAPPGKLAVAAAESFRGQAMEDAAAALARLSQLLSTRLTDASGLSADPGDKVACARAARHAASICSLLGRTPQP
jgi:hypothetical protein